MVAKQNLAILSWIETLTTKWINGNCDSLIICLKITIGIITYWEGLHGWFFPPHCITPTWRPRVASCYLHLLLLSITASHAFSVIIDFFNIAFSFASPFIGKPLKVSTIPTWKSHLHYNAPIHLTTSSIYINLVLVSTNVSKFFITKIWASNASCNSKSLTFHHQLTFDDL